MVPYDTRSGEFRVHFGVDRTHLEFWENRLQTLQARLATYGKGTLDGYRRALVQQIRRCETVLGWMRSSDVA